jgi:DNA-binding transcriptional ArsR family regulator
MRAPTPFEALERIFHEPNRLAIMSSLCASDDPLTFVELKAQCSLTDGNLNRHLKVLEESGAITITKRFVKKKPQTRVKLSATGLTRFSQYLEALDTILAAARQALPATAPKRSTRAAAPVTT